MEEHVDRSWLDEDVAGGMSSTTLVLGRGASAVDAVREADCDWSLIPYAPPGLRAKIDAVGTTGDVWLVAIVGADATALDRDPAVIAYGPAWRRSC